MRPSLFKTLAAKAVSGTTVYNGDPMQCQQMMSASVQVVMTGATVTGTAKLQFSNDPHTLNEPVNWSDVPGAANSISINGATALLYAIAAQDVCYNWLRVTYTNATNSGTITASIKGNGL